MGARGFIGADTRMPGLCHDDPEVTPPDRIRYDACMIVDESFRPEGEIGVQVLPGGDHAA
jgi:AraC family transcriptional regulator